VCCAEPAKEFERPKPEVPEADANLSECEEEMVVSLCCAVCCVSAEPAKEFEWPKPVLSEADANLVAIDV
jgi:hypothetical protein